MKTKLKMWNIGKNLGGEEMCVGCGNELDELLHISTCEALHEMRKGKKWEIWNSEKVEEITRFIKRYIELRSSRRKIENIKKGKELEM